MKVKLQAQAEMVKELREKKGKFTLLDIHKAGM